MKGYLEIDNDNTITTTAEGGNGDDGDDKRQKARSLPLIDTDYHRLIRVSSIRHPNRRRRSKNGVAYNIHGSHSTSTSRRSYDDTLIDYSSTSTASYDNERCVHRYDKACNSMDEDDEEVYFSDSSSSSMLSSASPRPNNRPNKNDNKINDEKRRKSKAYFKEALKAVQEEEDNELQIQLLNNTNNNTTDNHNNNTSNNEDNTNTTLKLSEIQTVTGPVVEKMLLNAVDRIEDEIDENIFNNEDLLPFHIKLAVEQNVFGWSNFFVDIFCHSFFAIGSYLLTYAIFTWLVLNKHNVIDALLDWCFIRDHVNKDDHVHVVGKDGVDTTELESDLYYDSFVQRYITLFEVLRIILSFSSGFSAFRGVRRRRRVWLQSSYKTSDVAEVDRTTFLGRVRSGLTKKKDTMLAKNVQNTIKKATKRFDKKRSKRRMKTYNNNNHSNYNHHVRLIGNKRRHFSYGKKRPVSLSFKVFHSNFPNKYLNRNNNSQRSMSSSSTSSSNCSNKKIHHNNHISHSHNCNHRYSQLSNNDDMIINEDSILFDDHSYMQEKIEVVPYSHGGFFGAAPLMLDDPFWVDVLRSLMPDVYCEVAKRVFSPTSNLIHWAENNPVVAAYGTVHEYIEHEKVSTIEWDVFLDPELVTNLEMSLHIRDQVRNKVERIRRTSSYHERKNSPLLDPSSRLQMIKSIEGHGHHSNNNRSFDYNSNNQEPNDEFNELFDEDCELLLKAHDIEVQKNTIHLVEKMLIAHGNLTQLVLEQTGYLKRYVFSRVKRSRKTLGGGIFTKQWLGLYAEALQIGIAGILTNNNVDSSKPNNNDIIMESSSSQNQTGGCSTNELIDSMKNTKLSSSNRSILIDQYSTSLNKLAQSKCRNSSILDSIKAMRSALGAPLGLVLDLKSRHVSNRIWSLVINALRDAGARVEYVASFIPEEIRGISKLCLAPVKEAIFCHGAGDLQASCHNGSIRKGDVVFFNAGSLIDNVTAIRFFKKFNANEYCRNYILQPWADWNTNNNTSDSEDSKTYQSEEEDESLEFLTPLKSNTLRNDATLSSSTIRDYKEHYNLTIGLYVQEFAIDDAATDLIVNHVNQNLDVYNLGLGWGGLNGVMVNGIHPGRFTSTDGFWNQRYGSVAWDCSLYPFGDDDDDE